MADRFIAVQGDAGIGCLVELGADDARRVLGAGATDDQVEAVRVVLRAADMAVLVEREELVSQDVIPRHDAGRDRRRPAKTLLDQERRGPSARHAVRRSSHGILKHADLLDLEPLELALVGALAGTSAVGHVVEHRPVMSFRPHAPVQRHLTARSHGRRGGAGHGTPVTDDVWAGVVRRGDEAPIRVRRGRPRDLVGFLGPVRLNGIVSLNPSSAS